MAKHSLFQFYMHDVTLLKTKTFKTCFSLLRMGGKAKLEKQELKK